MENIFKFLDIYKVDKKLNISENTESTTSRYTPDKVGSRVGGSFSLALYIIVLNQLVSQITRLHNGLDDI